MHAYRGPWVQERYWPHLLERLREDKEYDHVLMKSDYWKKFEGTVIKQGSFGLGEG